jgi:hypothetical protein
MSRVHRTRLHTRASRIDVRWTSFGNRWIASASTPDGPTLGPTLGVGWTPMEALTAALQRFEGAGGEAVEGADDTLDGLE